MDGFKVFRKGDGDGRPTKSETHISASKGILTVNTPNGSELRTRGIRNTVKVMNGTPKSVYDVHCVRNMGLPTGGDPYGNRAAMVR